MASKRDRIKIIVKYLESLGIEVNLCKNKARGNKGFFATKSLNYRIDVAKGLSEDAIISVLSHEFAHYAHFSIDKTLNSLDVLFENSEELLNDLINITVDLIPKSTVKPLFDLKENLKTEIKKYSEILIKTYPDFKNALPYKLLENKIKKTNYKYLLKYDKVKILEGFHTKTYSIEDLNSNEDEITYLKLKSKQRYLKRVNSKINRLNKYYNSHTELFARGFEMYATDRERFHTKAPLLLQKYDNLVNSDKLPILKEFLNILSSNI